MAQVHGLATRKLSYSGVHENTFVLVLSLIFSVDAFSGWITNMLNLEIFSGFTVLLSVALLDRGKLSCTRHTSKQMANNRGQTVCQ